MTIESTQAVSDPSCAKYWLSKVPRLPVIPGTKKAACTHAAATTEETQINKWLAKHYNLAVMCGDVPEFSTTHNLVVIDVDTQEADDALRRIEKEFGEIFPLTFRVNTSLCEKTGFQKRQYYYFLSKDVALKTCAALGGILGLDIRGVGGYVVGPGSKIPGHQYEAVNDFVPAVLPDALGRALAALNGDKHKASETEKISKGRRNDELTRRAGVLRSCGCDREAIEHSLQSINRNQCVPPLPESEVSTIAASVARYEPNQAKEKSKPKRKLFAVTAKSMADITDEVKVWIMLNMILAGELNLLIGEPDVGKGFFYALLIACITTGIDLAVAKNKTTRRKVVIYCTEDSYNATIKPRLIVAGANLENVIPIFGVGSSADDNEYVPVCLDQQEHVDAIQETVKGIGNIALIIFDPLADMSGATNIYHPDVRNITSKLTKLARETGAAVLLVHHCNKQSADSAIKVAAGNLQIMASVSICWLLAVSPEAKTQRLMMQVRNKSGQRRSFKYHITNQEWPKGFQPEKDDRDDEEYDGCGLFEFIGKSQMTADEFVQRAQEKDASANSRAMKWINEMLANGPVATCVAWQESETRGFTKDVVNRACALLMVKRDKKTWSLPKKEVEVKDKAASFDFGNNTIL